MHQTRHDKQALSSLKLASGSELVKASCVGDRQGDNDGVNKHSDVVVLRAVCTHSHARMSVPALLAVHTHTRARQACTHHDVTPLMALLMSTHVPTDPYMFVSWPFGHHIGPFGLTCPSWSFIAL